MHGGIMGILPSYSGCFVCGQDNIAGPNVTFVATPDGVQAEYTALEKHRSNKGILHGGVIGGRLDECLGWVVSIHVKKMTVTGELNRATVIPSLWAGQSSLKAIIRRIKIQGSNIIKPRGMLKMIKA
jgi:hypothetical protein